MKRGTTMVLKRLFVTALSALGLGAMVIGPAFADDPPGTEGIPAPNVFNGVVACGGGTLPPSITMTRSMGMTQSILDAVFDFAPGGYVEITSSTAGGSINDHADINNAAADAMGNARTPDFHAWSNALAPCASDPVGNGFARAVLLYNQVVAAEAALPAPGAPQNPTLTAAYNNAVAAFEEYSGTSLSDGTIGSVYDAIYAERATLATVTTAITAYNAHVAAGGAYATAWGTYNTVDVTNMTATLYGTNGVAGFEEISGAGILTANGGFNAAGVLQTTGMASGTTTTLGGVITQLNTEQTALDTAQDNLDTAIRTNASQSLIGELTEAVRRWTARRNHVSSELSRLLGIARIDTANDATHGAFIRGFDAAESTRSVLEATVRSSATALEMARNTVNDKLGDAGDYLQQLVTLRQWEYDQASAADQNNPRSTVNTNLAQAMAQQAAYTGLVANPDSPAGKLLDALLEPDTLANGNANPADDDGLALVSAIAEVDGKIADINALTGPGGEVTMNTENIATNTANIATNTANIATNTADIATNKANIATNTADIATNKANIATNAGKIEMNASEIMRVEGRVDSNWDAIAQNQMDIGSNRSMINDNRNMIGDLSDSLEVVRAGVAASMALAGMPAINGRGVSIGIGSYDGESAFAVGFQIQGEMASFKVGVTSAGGETGASAGVGFQF